jgi:hypothetical protein
MAKSPPMKLLRNFFASDTILLKHLAQIYYSADVKSNKFGSDLESVTEPGKTNPSFSPRSI